ncbi:hypothetical protein [Saccharopolyspora sp. NPDC049357]|uniref:hypothetical protein n=1 Tax=Saccharopolyspora sp. NPDC049357 TaxID=3154507 RepID=UPI0034291C78
MAVKTQWTLTLKCGHTETTDLSKKKPHERAGFARWLEKKRVCEACFKKDRNNGGEWIEDKDEWLKAKRAEEAEAAEQWAREANMPPLTGSDKAVAWANRVRHQALISLYRWAVEEGHAPDDYDQAEEIARSIDRAGWWLDQRELIEDDPEALLELLNSAAADEGVYCENTY